MGFPHGLNIDHTVNPAEADEDILEYGAHDRNFAFTDAEEAEEPQERYWLGQAMCMGTEEQLLDCNVGNGFLDEDTDFQECPRAGTFRLTVACRMFPINGIA